MAPHTSHLVAFSSSSSSSSLKGCAPISGTGSSSAFCTSLNTKGHLHIARTSSLDSGEQSAGLNRQAICPRTPSSRCTQRTVPTSTTPPPTACNPMAQHQQTSGTTPEKSLRAPGLARRAATRKGASRARAGGCVRLAPSPSPAGGRPLRRHVGQRQAANRGTHPPRAGAGRGTGARPVRAVDHGLGTI
jgi:hypothetical protein